MPFASVVADSSHYLKLGDEVMSMQLEYGTIHAQEVATIKLSSGCSCEVSKIYLAILVD